MNHKYQRLQTHFHSPLPKTKAISEKFFKKPAEKQRANRKLQEQVISPKKQ